jgi:hypothetical protein
MKNSNIFSNVEHFVISQLTISENKNQLVRKETKKRNVIRKVDEPN